MLKTVLIIVLINLANPSEPAQMLHKAFSSEQACQTAFINTMAEIPANKNVKVAAYCANIADLADVPRV